jgi:hypothetical protein
MSEKQATPDPIGSRDGMNAFAQGIMKRVQPARSVLSPWLQRWSEPRGQASGFVVQRRTTLTTERTSALVNRAQLSIGNRAIQRSNAVVTRPVAVAQRAGAVIRRLEGSAPKYEYRSGGYGTSVRTGFTLASPVVQASSQDGGETGTWSGGGSSTAEASSGFAPSPPQRLAAFDSKKEPSLIERLQRRLNDAKARQTSGGQVAKKPASRLARKEDSSSDKSTAASVQRKVRPVSRVEEVTPSASSKGSAMSRVDMKRVRVGEPRPARVQRESVPETPEDEEEIALKPVVQRAAPAEAQDEEEIALKPVVQRAAPEAQDEEEIALKPVVRRAAPAEAQDEEEIALKPVVQRAAPEAQDEEEIALKPVVQRAAPAEAQDEEEIALKPARVPLSKPMAVRSVQRSPRSERKQASLPLVTSQTGHESSGATVQRKAGDSARTDTRLSPLPLVQRGASQGAGRVQRAEIPSATAVSSSGTRMEDSSDAPQIDLDDLARTIYSHVRRLFAVERERKSSIR